MPDVHVCRVTVASTACRTVSACDVAVRNAGILMCPGTCAATCVALSVRPAAILLCTLWAAR